MSKKQTIRTLGSIERTQPTQPTPKERSKFSKENFNPASTLKRVDEQGKQ